ncbi:uncharacterized protein [Drosophila kikkawai]|uniref:Uncharacterized protein n=1 Tax=Drosophila kikkawai TaxID=30033 RepID=A0A6P4JUX4_DROKI|nr:uncharacterized protein LOC108086122 [Drosophila kikkawai]
MSHRRGRHQNRKGNPSRDDDDPFRYGSGRGSHQAKMLGQNFDFAGFIPLVKSVYIYMAARDYHLERRLPFCVFQHAMTEILTARMLEVARHRCYAKYYYEDFFIPLPIYLYIQGIGKTMMPDGTQIYWNLPEAATPQRRIKGEKPCRSGTFGIPTAANHNAYECYISPYITSEYIKRQALVTDETEDLNWNPFPNGWLPAECEVNENLLGYHPLEKLHIEGIRKCSGCTFVDSDDTGGILCHSRGAMLTSSIVVGNSGVKCVKAVFEHTENIAAFLFKEYEEKENLKAVLWEEPSTMYAPCALSAINVNQGSYFGYKRKRNAAAPGAFALCNGKLIDGWLETINDNFEYKGLFGLSKYGYNHMQGLSSADHHYGQSWLLDVSSWIYFHMKNIN